MHEFLYEKYFPLVVFELVYFRRKKIFKFDDKLDILGFEQTVEGLRSALKH